MRLVRARLGAARRGVAGWTAPDVSRALRAEVILMAAIGVVSLLVVAMAALVWSGERLQREEHAVVDRVRTARAQLILASQAQNDAEAISARYAATGNRAVLQDFEQAKASARAYLDELRATVADDADAGASITRIENLVERRFTILDAEIAAGSSALSATRQEVGVYSAFREETAALFTLFNSRIDDARIAQAAARRQLNIVAITLAALSLIASGLAIFALRREREQWRLAQAATETARAQAAASDLAKSRFLAVASHDMRQPLHALTLYLSALERRVQGEEARDIIRKMDRATQSMIGMFSMLLDLARVQAGVVTPEIVDAPLQPVIDRIAAEHPSGKVEAASSPLAVRTDPLLLERIIANLVVNALKHGGGKARLSARAEGDAAVIEVADNGPGIPPADQERIFEEFVRLDARGEGLGLGLAIVRGVARLLGISIELESELGRGTLFRLRLPLAQAPKVPAAPAAGAAALSGAAVLVMDDEPLAREAMAATLRDHGADLRVCADAEEVTAALDAGFRPRLLLLDLRIAGQLRGIDVANAARARLGASTRALIVTGDTDPDTLAALRASGHAWLIKPVDADDLLAAAAAQLHLSET